MLTALGSKLRRDRLWRALTSECDVLLVADPSHLIYLAAFVPSPFVFRTVESAALLILEPDRATLVADDMLGPFLDRAFVDEIVAPCWYDGNHSAPHRRTQLVESTLNRLSRMSRQSASASSSRAFPRASSKACVRLDPGSRSSTSPRSFASSDAPRILTRSRSCVDRCAPAKRGKQRLSSRSSRA